MGVFADKRGATAGLPSGLGAQPLTGRIGKRPARFGMEDLADRAALQPMLVGDALVRFSDRAQRRPAAWASLQGVLS